MSLHEALATLELPVRRFRAELERGESAGVIDLAVKGVRMALMPTASKGADSSPHSRQSRGSGLRKKRQPSGQDWPHHDW